MVDVHQRFWIKAIWAHYRATLPNTEAAKRLIPTSRRDCIKATFAVLLGREQPEILDFDYYNDHPWFDPENYTLAWANFGTYETDYGTGESWEYLVVGPKLTYAIGQDWSL
jgi:hypothetical protein